ncbi:MAG TPA: hypothetical protein PKA74_20260 [Bauldia sp.]|nr:hypothetical protein [Bauldia sp.]
MNDVILFIHFFGLMLGSAGGLASGMLMRKALPMPPEQAQTIRGLGPLLANVSGIGLVLLWITGVIMVFSKWGGIAYFGWAFWVKMGFVLLLTAASVVIHMTYAEIAKGNRSVAVRLPKLGPVSGLSALLAVFFAVLAFH